METKENRLATFFINEVKGVLSKNGFDFSNSPLTPKEVADTFKMYDEKFINKQNAIILLQKLIDQAIKRKEYIKECRELLNTIPEEENKQKEVIENAINEWENKNTC